MLLMAATDTSRWICHSFDRFVKRPQSMAARVWCARILASLSAGQRHWMCASVSLAPPQSKHAGEFVRFHLKRTALLGYVPAIDWRIRLFRGVICIEPSTPPSVLRPWSGRSSHAVDSGMCAGATDPSRRRCSRPIRCKFTSAATWTTWSRSCESHSTGAPLW